uniref:Uncharacterized protein n=3 Tax=melanogaster subgroup TaxID=32351 RepID=A0A0B4K7X6_DROME|nr:uncharacterized protein Dmel_CG43204 [Drosophila melanogaster]AFH08033.1 uncharacterized protein Dmel_CG43204 [Drosophila melanogaster]|eukprot:NP_001246279.1 uncharacterized protein Dmel_CG43204 [Drosophila melanogaster]
MALVFILLILLLGFVGYVAYVVHKKGIDPKDIRIHSLQDAKKLLKPPPSGNGPHKYLEKRA